ncbi:hypothetical protein E4U57_001199, partial [Claviceps arundinis]
KTKKDCKQHPWASQSHSTPEPFGFGIFTKVQEVQVSPPSFYLGSWELAGGVAESGVVGGGRRSKSRDGAAVG